MALIECHECKKSISGKAKICPQCGAKSNRVGGFGLFIFGTVIVFAVLMLIAGIAQEQLSYSLPQHPVATKEQDEANRDWAATEACHGFIEKSLKDPDSVKYPDGDSGATVNVEKDGIYRVRVTARAKNSFGALVPSIFQCRVSRIGDKWFLHGLKETSLQ